MEFRKFGDKYVVRIDKGEEIVEQLTKICKDENIKLGSVTGIGATNDITIGLFVAATKEYRSSTFAEDFEIAPLAGNISTMNGEPYLHLHINIAGGGSNAMAGHLNRAVVSATFEAVITVIDGEVDRKKSEEIGLNLIEF